MAKVVALVNRNPNILAVYVLGNHEFGALTISKLNEIDRWGDDVERLVYKTGTSAQSIATAVERLDGRVYFPRDETELIETLTPLILPTAELKPNDETTSSSAEYRFLQRNIDLGDRALSKYDGCSVRTIAEAFPVILDIAREPHRENFPMNDQAGERFVELVDFKVILTDPEKDSIPAFYRGDELSLEAYFKKQFIEDTGLFAKPFKTQIDTVLTHLTESISHPTHPFCTRRAVLVVPNDVRPNEELQPLGLISVRLVPRFEKSRITLGFSFTWRTVEALVGFPYSIFGSVKYAAHLTDLLRDQLDEPYRGNLKMGQVSYIAHSLHIFLDEQRQNIARRIVDNASL